MALAPAIDSRAIAAMLDPVFPDCDIVRVEPLAGGFSNTNLKVTVEGFGEPFVLRCYTRQPAACLTELRLSELIGGRIPIPRILYADPAGMPAGVPYAVLGWVNGVPLTEVLDRGSAADLDQAGEAAGMMLARIGTFHFPYASLFSLGIQTAPPTEDGNGYVNYLQTLFSERASKKLGSALTHRLKTFVATYGHLLDTVTGERSLVHSDYNGKNILMGKRNSRWQVAAVLDWEYAYSGSPLADIGNLLRDELPESPVTQAVARGFRRGGGWLPRGWLKLARLLDLMSAAEFLNRDDDNPREATVRWVSRILDSWGSQDGDS